MNSFAESAGVPPRVLGSRHGVGPVAGQADRTDGDDASYYGIGGGGFAAYGDPSSGPQAALSGSNM